VDGDDLFVSDFNPSTSAIDPVTRPTKGRLTLNSNGSFTYKPKKNFTGTDRFRYRICGPGRGQCSTATVTVEVRPQGS
jgi:large repetitive protein